MNEKDIRAVIHDLNTSRYQLEAAMGILEKESVPKEVFVLQKSIMEKITRVRDLVVQLEQPDTFKGKSI